MGSLSDLNELLDQHVSLDLECLDRIYLNAYIPPLQSPGGVVIFLTQHRGYPIPSPALLGKLGNRFRARVYAFAKEQQVPLVQFKAGKRKIEVMRPYFAKAQRAGVVAIGVAQEFQSVYVGYKRPTRSNTPHFNYSRAPRRVTCFYFYLLDPDFGPSFIKLCAYFPYSGKVWVNGHEWAKRQAARTGIGFTELANGFASCDDHVRLQAICNRLGPAQLQRFFSRWMTKLPTPLDRSDREAGYRWELSLRQIEVSRTLVFAQPRDARRFFDALLVDNLTLGRPDQVELIFGRRIRRTTPGRFATAVTQGTEVRLNIFYRSSRLKEYLKEGRALRLELVCNSPDDLGCRRRLPNLPVLQAKARQANARLLRIQRAGQGCAVSTALFERVALPSIEKGQRTGALRFGDARAMALAGALCANVHAVRGFSNRSLRAQVAQRLGAPYSAPQMTYDLRRLRLKGLVRRLGRTHTYMVTAPGIRLALFYTKLHDRLLRPLFAADHPPAPPALRQALQVIDRSVEDYVRQARIAA